MTDIKTTFLRKTFGSQKTSCFQGLLVFMSMLFTVSLFAQVKDAGSILQWIQTADGLSGQTELAQFKIQVYNQNTIRVRLTLKDNFDEFSYVLINEDVVRNTVFTIAESAHSIFVQTAALDVEIKKTPSFRVIFRNKFGKIINEDVEGKGFGTSFIGERSTLYKKMQAGERFVGLGEVLGNLDKKGNGFLLNNTDTYKYGDPRLPMYVSIPFYIGIHNEEVYALFYHNSHKTFFNFGLSTPNFTSVTAEGGDLDYFLIYDSSIEKILFHYTALTGRMQLPPKWSLGYHQSRCSYFPDSAVRLIAESFRAKKLPIDCIVLDADYLHEYEPFRINTKRFPDMSGLSSQLKKLNIEITASVNPGIKIDTTYFAYHDGLEKDVFVKFTDGSLYEADIAPSFNHFVDFTSPKARKWWADNMKFLAENGIHGYWNDMNEPAVGGSYLPDNLLFDFDGRKATALEAKNLYGMLMARSSFESAIKYGGNKRPFVLSRSGFAGIQRYAAVWTGDNTASDEFLLGGTLLNTQLGLSGLAFVGDDIGGYIGPTSKNLFIRWMQLGMFQPFARNHKEAFSTANEPWAYGEEAEAIVREYMNFRYQAMPYLYSLFYNAAQTGLPVVRSLCIENPFDPNVFNTLFQYQFMLGDAMLIVPVTSSESFKEYYLPAGKWFDIYSDLQYSGNQIYSKKTNIQTIPVFVKESSIIPMQSLVQSTKEQSSDTLYLHVYNGIKPNSFTWYEDDGETNNHLDGQFYKRSITFVPEKKQLIFDEASGNYQTHFKYVKCYFHGFSEIFRFRIREKELAKNIEEIKILDGLRFLNDYYDSGYYKSLLQLNPAPKCVTISFPLQYGNQVINWY